MFEVQVDNGMGAQNAIGGGGRYDQLAEDVGVRPTPGLGYFHGRLIQIQRQLRHSAPPLYLQSKYTCSYTCCQTRRNRKSCRRIALDEIVLFA